MSALEKLFRVQQALKAPKGQFNKFGNYSYRSLEDIQEAAKPVLLEAKAATILSDEVVLIGARFYIKATATFSDSETGEKIEVTAYAREEETKKGMDGSQITGASSSYARKYALNGLYAIDDTKDSDETNTEEKNPEEKMTYDKALEYKITFGKHSGKTLKEIYKGDRAYIEWLEGGEKTDATIKEAIRIINEQIAKSKAEKK